MGLDLLILLSYTFHVLPLLDVSCFKSFKNAFRHCHDIWSLATKMAGAKEEELTHLVSISLKWACTPSNIMGFKASDIPPLDTKIWTIIWRQANVGLECGRRSWRLSNHHLPLRRLRKGLLECTSFGDGKCKSLLHGYWWGWYAIEGITTWRRGDNEHTMWGWASHSWPHLMYRWWMRNQESLGFWFYTPYQLQVEGGGEGVHSFFNYSNSILLTSDKW